MYLHNHLHLATGSRGPKESARVQQTLALKENKLTAKAVVDSMGIYLTYKDRYKEKVKVQTIETVIEKEINVLKWWQKALMATVAVSMLILASTIIAKFIRPKFQPHLNESGSHPTKNETRLSTFLSAWYSDKVYTGTI